MAKASDMRRGFIGGVIAASLLSLLAGCALVPPPAADGLPTPASPPASATRSSLAKRILERLHKPLQAAPENTPPVAAVPAEPVEVDKKYQLTGEEALELERGKASWYGAQFHGRRTASGEAYDKYALTAAHKTLPFGTIVRVRSLALGREVDVRINDRGPFSPGRVIDVSQAAAEALGLTAAGVAEVSLNVAESTLEAVGVAASVRNSRRGSKARAKTRPKRHSPTAKQR